MTETPIRYNDAQIIEEFRSNGGVVGGDFARVRLLLLCTIGARSEMQRETPLFYRPDGDNFVVFGSQYGAPNHPGWYHNLVAHPSVRVEVGTEVFDALARVTTGEERDRRWKELIARYERFHEYEVRAAPYRVIPVVVLER